jgi:hypothetical protein
VPYRPEIRVIFRAITTFLSLGGGAPLALLVVEEQIPVRVKSGATADWLVEQLIR